MLEANLGALFGPQQADPTAYASMTNVAWDDHYYGWETQGDADGGQSVQENVGDLQNEVAGAAGITESNGAGGQRAIPTIIGEYGNATTGLTIDPNGTAAVDAVQTANNEGLVQGAVAWEWDQYNPPGNANAITASAAPTTLTPYGQEIVNYVNTGATGIA
jgi:hypothetical protein